MRFFYKQGNNLLNLKTPDFNGVEGFERITAEKYQSILEQRRLEREKRRAERRASKV